MRKCHPVQKKTVTTASSTPISETSPAAHPSFPFSSSSVVFVGSSQLLLPAFVTPRMTPTGFVMLRVPEAFQFGAWQDRFQT